MALAIAASAPLLNFFVVFQPAYWSRLPEDFQFARAATAAFGDAATVTAASFATAFI